MLSKPALNSFVESIIRPDIFFPNIVAAAVLAVMNITTAISIGALVFSGPLTPYLSVGIGLFLVGTALGGLFVAAASGYKAIVAGPRSGQAPIVASIAAGIVVSMQGQPVEAMGVTTIAAILLASLLISILLFGLGWAKLGGMVRYIPYPVMGGFFAGLGFLLFKGGVLVTLGPLAVAGDLSSYISGPSIAHLAPALAFAVLLYVLDENISHWLLMPLYLLATVVVFYAVMYATGTSVETAVADHWLPDMSLGDARFFPVITPDQLALVDWSAIMAQSSTILVMALMSVIMLLLDTSGVEIVIDRDLDPNHELKAAGIANFFNGLGTGIIAIQAAADTAFTYKLGGTRFLTLVAYAIFIFIVIWIGPSPITYVPKLILGGLLMYIGMNFLFTWVWRARKKLPLKDFAVVCGILFVVATYGILEGVAIGVILAILLFVHSYSQLSVIKSSISGAEHVSNVDRDQKQTHYLDQHGDEIHIFVLQGFLFFGTASRLLEDIRQFIEDPKRSKVRYLLLDFNRVDAMDTSAANSFAKLVQICRKNGTTLVLTGCSAEIATRFEALSNDISDYDTIVNTFKNLEEGFSWCGDKILENFEDDEQDDDPSALFEQLLGDEKAARVVANCFEQMSFKTGDILFRQGDPGDSLYLIFQGSVSVVLDLPNDQVLHLRTMRSGAIFGEMALYTAAPRSASALVNEDSVLFKLEEKKYKILNEYSPEEARYFHVFIVRLMSERLARANREIVALSR